MVNGEGAKARGTVVSGLILTLLILSAASFLEGQSATTGAIFGDVRDQTGALVVDAEVSAVNLETGLKRTTATTSSGYFQLSLLPPGQFTVRVTASGFSMLEKTGVVVAATQSTKVDVTVLPAGVATSIGVESTAPLVNTNDAELGATLESHLITALPIVNRNVYTLLNIVPGVQLNSSKLGLGLPEQHTSINGGLEAGYSGSVNYLLDGGSNVGSLRNSGNIMPNPDAIAEFRVLTNNYSAEYGRFAGGVISVVTKSGTNDFHGTVFEFLRNNDFDANNWGSTIPLAPLHRNQFGFTLGGPIRKNRTFFFGSYAGLRQNSYTFVNTAVLPTALERSGNFSQSLDKPIDPLTGNPFPGEVIPASRMDPVALNVPSTYVPALANGPGNTYQANIPTPTNSNEVLAKIDHQISENQQVAASYFGSRGFQWVDSGNSPLPYSASPIFLVPGQSQPV